MNPVKDYDHLLEKYLRLIDNMADLELERQTAAYERDRARMLLTSTEAQFLHALARIAALESGGAQ